MDSEKECQRRLDDASLIAGGLREEKDWRSKRKIDADPLLEDWRFHLNDSPLIKSGSTALKALGFTKVDRIKTAKEYRTLSKYGKRWHSRLFVIVFQNSQQSRSRLGITVSKKVGKAVTRNRIKRIIREYFRLNISLLPIKLDINIIARQSSGTVGVAALREQLEFCLKSIADDPEHR
jgi:ribonuclease P protein component